MVPPHLVLHVQGLRGEKAQILSTPTAVNHGSVILMLLIHAMQFIQYTKKGRAQRVKQEEQLTWLRVLGRKEEYRFTIYHNHKRMMISIKHVDREV